MKLRLGRTPRFSIEELEREAAAEIEKRVSMGKPPPEEWAGVPQLGADDLAGSRPPGPVASSPAPVSGRTDVPPSPPADAARARPTAPAASASKGPGPKAPRKAASGAKATAAKAAARAKPATSSGAAKAAPRRASTGGAAAPPTP